jgi:hypothetical protein
MFNNLCILNYILKEGRWKEPGQVRLAIEFIWSI